MHRPFYAEWKPSVVVDRQRFVEVLLQTVGPRAVTEFIDAVGHTQSEQAAGPLRQWWQEHASEAPEPGA